MDFSSCTFGGGFYKSIRMYKPVSLFVTLSLLLLYIAKPSVPPASSEITAIEMQEVIFRCDSTGEPAVTNRWFYTNTSGKLF